MIKYIVDEVFVKASVDARNYGNRSQENYEAQMFSDAKTLMAEIKRHCDYYDLAVSNHGHYKCTFCGYESADKDDYECCDESIDEHEEKAKGK